jgi:hypothetical protein
VDLDRVHRQATAPVIAIEKIVPVRQLAAEFARAGVELEVDGEKLRMRIADGSVPPDLVARAKALKPELIAFLADDTVPF